MGKTEPTVTVGFFAAGAKEAGPQETRPIGLPRLCKVAHQTRWDRHGWAIPPFWVDGPRREGGLEGCCHSSLVLSYHGRTDGRISVRRAGARGRCTSPQALPRDRLEACHVSGRLSERCDFETSSKLTRDKAAIFDIETWHEISHPISQQESVRSTPSRDKFGRAIWIQSPPRSYRRI